MNIKVINFITDLISKFDINEEQKKYWLTKTSKLSEEDLKKLYEILTTKDLQVLAKFEKSEIEKQKILKQKLADIPKEINSLFKAHEEKSRKEENPEELLKQI